MLKITSLVLISAVLTLTASLTGQQEQKARRVTRVARPDVPKRSEIYFDDIFAEALAGNRPQPASNSKNLDGEPAGDAATATADAAGYRWSGIVSRESVEDEVKRLNQQLQRSITTPSGFNSQAQRARQQFSLLSMLFAIIRQYDKDVRWKEFGPTAQASFADAARQARTPSRQSFQIALNAKADLNTLVRGGSIPLSQNSTPVNWPDVIGRRATMVRLEKASRETLKNLISDKATFDSNKDRVKREAELIAAIGKVLVQRDMDDAEDDGYVDFSKAMTAAARQLAFAAENGEFDSATASLNRIEQSCSNCHAEWR